MKNAVLVLFLSPALAACGGSSTPVETTRTAPATAAINPMTPTVTNTVAVNYDTATSMFAFTANTVAATELAEEPGRNNGRLLSFADPGADEYAFAYQSGNSIAAVMATQGNIGQPSGTGAYGGLTYRRTGAATVPLTGSATYTGDYAGYLRRDLTGPNDDILYRVNGDVSLTAGFASNLVNGTITNREMRNRINNTIVAAVPVADVTLQNANLDNNLAFSGNATGGEVTVAGWTASPGIYSGVIAGPDGANETVGAVAINHLNGAIAHTEIGIFSAN